MFQQPSLFSKKGRHKSQFHLQRCMPEICFPAVPQFDEESNWSSAQWYKRDGHSHGDRCIDLLSHLTCSFYVLCIVLDWCLFLGLLHYCFPFIFLGIPMTPQWWPKVGTAEHLPCVSDLSSELYTLIHFTFTTTVQRVSHCPHLKR